VYVGLLIATPFLVRRLSRTAVWLLLFGLSAYVFWFFLMQQTRYLIPVLPALALIGAEALVRAWDETRIARWFGAGLVGASALWALYVGAAYIAAPALPVVASRMTRDEYVARGLPGLAQAVASINAQTPPNVKVALFDETRGFYLDREYLWATPNHSTVLPWDTYQTPADFAQDFARRGFTVLLWNRQNRPRPGSIEAARPWRALVQGAIDQGLVRLVYANRGVEVYQIVEPARQ
jgi:hypothetical protein